MTALKRSAACLAWLALAGLAGLAGSALAAGQAAPLPDPTRPPAEALLAPGEVPAAPVSTQPTLQSVLISERPGGRRVAVIDGETVRLGGTFNGAVLVRVSTTEVALRRGKTIEVLTLSDRPPPEKTPAEKALADKALAEKAMAGKPPVTRAAESPQMPSQLPSALPAALIKMLTQ
jgi:MSHA biogenesis protein MshK